MNKEKIIKQDNLNYLFKPGKNASLTADAPKKPSLIEMLSQDKPRMAKTIMPPPQTPVKMADGGLVDDENNKLMDWVKNVPGGTVQSPQPQTVQSPVDTNSGSQEEQESMKDNNESRIGDSNPGHTSEDLLGAETSQKMMDAGKYGPDQEKAVMDAIKNSQGSLRNRFARAGAGLGDAIMGVAGKQSPGFLKILEDRQNTQAERAINANPLLQKMNAEKMANQERLEGQSSSTPLGASQTAPLAAFFERVGIPKAEIPKMLQNPAAARSVVDAFATVMSKDEQIKMETMLKQLELAQRGQQLNSENTNKQTERSQEQQKIDFEKQKSEMEHPFLTKINKLMGNSSSGNEGPLGATTVKNGKTYEWSQATGKYHLKQ